MFKKFLAVAVLTAAAIVTVPLAANAAGYVPAAQIIVSDSTPEPGDQVTITFTAGSFTPGEDVTASVSGEPTPAIAIVKTGVASTTKAAAADGSVVFYVTPGAPGVVTLTAVGEDSGNIGVATLTIAPADSGNNANGPGGLPNTGSQIPVLALWAGGGILALGVALVLVMIITRRRNHTA